MFPFHKERPKFPPVLEIFIKFSNCKDSRKSRPWEFLKMDRNRWESGKVLELIYFVQQMKPYFPSKLFTCSSELTRRFFSDKIRDSFGLATDSCISVFLCSSRRFETGAAQLGKPWCHTPQSTNQNSKNLNPHSPDEAEKQSVLNSLHLTTRYAAKLNVLDQFKQFWIFNVKWDKLKIWI